MSQTTFGQTDALALAIVTWLNDAARNFVIPISAERRFARKTELKDIPIAGEPASVDVFIGNDAGERSHDGTRYSLAPVFSSTYGVNIFIQQRVGGMEAPEAHTAILVLLRGQIIDQLRQTRFNLTNAVRPVNGVLCVSHQNGDKGPYNLERLEGDNTFESDTIFVFKAAA